MKVLVLAMCSVFLFGNAMASDDIETHPNLKLLPTDCGLIDEDRILTNRPHLFEFPWMTVFPSKDSEGKTIFFCDGTLINSRYVLTAAHCAKRLDKLIVRIGEYDLTSDMDCVDNGGDTNCKAKYQDIPIEETLIHPESSVNKLRVVKADIALIRLQTPVNLELPDVGAVCLPTTTNLRNLILSHVSGKIVGWGILDGNATILQKVTLRISTGKENSSIYDKLCAEGSALFESGSPLMIKAKKDQDYEKYIQYGLLLFSKWKNLTGVYTDVSKYMKWILDSIRP